MLHHEFAEGQFWALSDLEHFLGQAGSFWGLSLLICSSATGQAVCIVHHVCSYVDELPRICLHRSAAGQVGKTDLGNSAPVVCEGVEECSGVRAMEGGEVGEVVAPRLETTSGDMGQEAASLAERCRRLGGCGSVECASWGIGMGGVGA